MLDIKMIRETPHVLDEALKNRGNSPLSSEVLAHDLSLREAIQAAQACQSKRNELSKQFGMKKAKGEDVSALQTEMNEIKILLPELEAAEAKAESALQDILLGLPNIPDNDVPIGADDSFNKVLREWGEPTRFTFTPQEHSALGEALRGMSFKQAAIMSGSRFNVLFGEIARLERALGQFMLDTHTNEFGYLEVSPPLLVKANAMLGTGQLPKFEEDLFKTTTDYYLIPTAEVSLTNLVADSILTHESLPLRYTALTPCFRSEAGSAGRDTHGMLRQHQFYKVELVSIVTAELSSHEHERMTHAAETILQKLGLPYRVMLLSTGDMGFSAQKTYDLEVWMPSQNMYREISSCSNCGDFQARRMKARYKDLASQKNLFVHTLNGSGVAVGRALIAVLENYQQSDGSIIIPDILRPYMNNQTKIERL